MRIAVGTDHAGVPLNETVIAELTRLGHEVVDCGTHDPSKPDDYQGVEHDTVNVLCMGSRVIGPELALDLVRTFLAANFSGEERHRRRLAKITALEEHDWRGRK